MGGREARPVEPRVDEVPMMAEPAVVGAPVEMLPVEVMLAEVVATAMAEPVLAVPVRPIVAWAEPTRSAGANSVRAATTIRARRLMSGPPLRG
jgi:hypothetical protein